MNATSSRFLALKCTTSNGNDGSYFLGFGTSGENIQYSAGGSHYWYTDTRDNANGTYIAALSSTGLHVSTYYNYTVPSGTYGYYGSAGYAASQLGPSISFSFSINSSRGVLIDSGYFVSTSDRRVKNDIHYYQEHQKKRIVDGLRNLDIASFTFKKDEHKSVNLGLIAQDVLNQNLFELVTMTKNEELLGDDLSPAGIQLGIAYDRIAVMLIPYVQELEKRIADLEDIVKAQKNN